MAIADEDFRELRTRVAQLEKDVIHLTVWRNVVAILGVLLGLSGPWLYNTIRGAIDVSSQLVLIRGTLNSEQKASNELRSAMAQTDAELRSKAEGAVREQAAKLVPDALRTISTNVVHFDDEIVFALQSGPYTRYMTVSGTNPDGGGPLQIIDYSLRAGNVLRLERAGIRKQQALPYKPPSKVIKKH